MSTPAERIFRVLIAALAVSTGIGVWFALAHRPELQMGFPGSAADWVYIALLVTGGVGLVSLGGLWFWQRWGVVLYCAGVLASVILDVLAQAPALHQATVVVAAVAVLGLAYANRGRFGPTPSRDAA